MVPVDADGVVLDDADVRAAELAGRIMSAETLEQLKALVGAIKSLPQLQQVALREAYAVRQQALKGVQS